MCSPQPVPSEAALAGSGILMIPISSRSEAPDRAAGRKAGHGRLRPRVCVLPRANDLVLLISPACRSHMFACWLLIECSPSLSPALGREPLSTLATNLAPLAGELALTTAQSSLFLA